METPLDSPKIVIVQTNFCLVWMCVVCWIQTQCSFVVVLFHCVNASGSFQVSVVLKFVFAVSAVFGLCSNKTVAKVCVQFQLCSNLTRGRGTKQKWSESSRPPWTISHLFDYLFSEKVNFFEQDLSELNCLIVVLIWMTEILDKFRYSCPNSRNTVSHFVCTHPV